MGHPSHGAAARRCRRCRHGYRDCPDRPCPVCCILPDPSGRHHPRRTLDRLRRPGHRPVGWSAEPRPRASHCGGRDRPNRFVWSLYDAAADLDADHVRIAPGHAPCCHRPCPVEDRRQEAGRPHEPPRRHAEAGAPPGAPPGAATGGTSRSVSWFSCSRTTDPSNYVYRWGCAGANNVYLLGHAWGVFKALHDAYYNGRLRKGMKVIYADGSSKVHTYSVIWWKVVAPTTAASWAWAAQSVPSMTLQTCLGSNSQYRLMVRLVRVA
ncbi:MAG: sortase [Chloroflexi bacterium]|nr:MAG: sortase [Chloroflexota bacterium]